MLDAPPPLDAITCWPFLSSVEGCGRWWLIADGRACGESTQCVGCTVASPFAGIRMRGARDVCNDRGMLDLGNDVSCRERHRLWVWVFA